jgi:hypothetical protein
MKHSMVAAGLATFLTVTAAFSVTAELFKDRSNLIRIGPNPSAIAAADLNSDGWPDIVTADTGSLTDPREERPANDELSLLISQGNLQYVKYHPTLKTGFAPYAIEIANIDARKWPDILVGNFLDTRHRDISVFRNLQDNLFETVELRIPEEQLAYFRQRDGEGFPLFTKPGITSLAIADVNRDSYRDLVAAAWSSDVLVYFPGDPETFFGAPRFIAAPGAPRTVRLADLNGDQDLDLVCTLYSVGEVGLWKGNGSGDFELAGRIPTRGRLPHGLVVADMNLDGIKDLVVSHRHTDDSVVIMYGDGDFNFSISQELALGESRQRLEHQIQDIVLADFNGDGRTDIAVACSASQQVVLLVNTSEDTSRAQRFSEEVYKFGEGRPRALCTADFDQDEVPDLAVALADANAVVILASGGKSGRDKPPVFQPPAERAQPPRKNPVTLEAPDTSTAEEAAPETPDSVLEPTDPDLLLEPLDLTP